MWRSWADQSTLSYKGFFGRPRMSEFNWTLITNQFSQWDGCGVWLVGEPELDSFQSEALSFLLGLLALTLPLPPTAFHFTCSIFESCFYFLKRLRCFSLFGLVCGSWRSWLQSQIAPQYLASMLLTHSSSILFRCRRPLANIYWDKCGLTGVVKWEKQISNITNISPISSLYFEFHIYLSSSSLFTAEPLRSKFTMAVLLWTKLFSTPNCRPAG